MLSSVVLVLGMVHSVVVGPIVPAPIPNAPLRTAVCDHCDQYSGVTNFSVPYVPAAVRYVEEDTMFRYQQRVEVRKGFYRGSTGKVQSHKDGSYTVYLDNGITIHEVPADALEEIEECECDRCRPSPCYTVSVPV